jgi:hypothetical protein
LIEAKIYLNDHKLILNKISFMVPVENLNSAFGGQSFWPFWIFDQHENLRHFQHNLMIYHVQHEVS